MVRYPSIPPAMKVDLPNASRMLDVTLRREPLPSKRRIRQGRRVKLFGLSQRLSQSGQTEINKHFLTLSRFEPVPSKDLR